MAVWTILNFHCALLLASSGSGNLHRYEFSRLEMGTLFRVVIYAETPEPARIAAQAALDRIRELNGILSDYQEDSELNQMCRTAFEGPQVVSPELFFVLQKSLEISQQTGGAFDITIRPVVDLWREAGIQKKLPDPEQIKDALSRTGYQKILLNNLTRSVRLRQKGMTLDLGGIAKGYALDEAMRVLEQHGMSISLVDGGGDVRVGDAPPGARGWKIKLTQSRQAPLYLRNLAVATSGDTYRFVEIDGIRYSHIVDPSTGLGLKASPLVTVIAPDGIDADALATALSVMPLEKGLRLVEELPNVETRIVIQKENEEKRVIVSSGFPS